LRALTRSSLPPAEQLLWYIDAELKDEYTIFDNTEDFIKKRGYKKADWQMVSVILESRLQEQTVPQDYGTFSDNYKRENLSRWLQTALERSGRQTDIIDLLQREAPITHCYDKLVSALLTAGREHEAHDWIVEDFTKTIDKLPGIAWKLAEQLRDMALRKNSMPTLRLCWHRNSFTGPTPHCTANWKKRPNASATGPVYDKRF